LSSEPGLGNVPIAFGGGTGDTEDFGGFFSGQTAEEAEFDEAALLLVDLGEGLEGIIEGDDVGVAELGKGLDGIKLDAAVGTALCGAAGTGVVDEDLAHQPSGDTDKVGTIFGLERTLVAKAQVGFVDESGGLQGMAGTFTLEIVVGHGAEFGVHERDESLQGVLVAGSPFHQQLADRMGG